MGCGGSKGAVPVDVVPGDAQQEPAPPLKTTSTPGLGPPQPAAQPKVLPESEAEDTSAWSPAVHDLKVPEQNMAFSRVVSLYNEVQGGAVKPISGLSAGLGWAVVREDRHVWRERLNRGAVYKPQPASAEHSAALLSGKLWHTFKARKSRSIKYLLSSTFTDTALERDLLMADVLPYLEEYAQNRQFEFMQSEMRWGIREVDSDNHQTSKICMQELARCMQESAGISYILLACNKYGFRPFPSEIPFQEFEDLMKALGDMPVAELMEKAGDSTNKGHTGAGGAADEERWWDGGVADFLRGFYCLDENDVSDDDAGSYILKSKAGVANWWPKFLVMQRAFHRAACALWPEDTQPETLRDPHSKCRARSYLMSVTEEEVCNGLLWNRARDKSAWVFARKFAPEARLAQDKALKDYYDAVGQGGEGGLDLDEESQGLLESLHTEMVPAVLSEDRITRYEGLEWGPGIDPARNKKHREYLASFCDSFCKVICDSIDKAAQDLALEYDPVEAEIERQMLMCKTKVAQFLETRSTAKVLKAVHTAVEEGGELVVFGKSGSGKTFLMSKAVEQTIGYAKEAGGVVVFRFIGTTPHSSNLFALLTSLTTQIRLLYGDKEPVSESLAELCNQFLQAVTKLPTEEKPLYLILDSLDQLASYSSRKLEWLVPVVESLGKNTTLILSTLPDQPGMHMCLSILRQHKSAKRQDYQDVPVVTEADVMLPLMLRRRQRQLTEAQKAAILADRDKVGDTGTPLWLNLVVMSASTWRSFDPIPKIQTTVRGLIWELFEKMEDSHGKNLVRSSLAYITVAVQGVSESEMRHLLSLNDDVLADVYQWWCPPVRVVPPLLVTRFLQDLQVGITRRGDRSGQSVVSWYHRQFREAAGPFCFGFAGSSSFYIQDRERSGHVEDGERPGHYMDKAAVHQEMAEYFQGQWCNKPKPYNANLAKVVQRFFPGETEGMRYVPNNRLLLSGNCLSSNRVFNFRRVHECVHHLTAAGMEQGTISQLTNIQYVIAKFAALSGFDLQNEIMQAMQWFPVAQEKLLNVRSFVGRNFDILLDPPLLSVPFQLALQEPDHTDMCRSAQELLTDALGVPALREKYVHWPMKPQNCDACIFRMAHHNAGVLGVHLSSDARQLVSLSEDRTVKVCSLSTGEVDVTITSPGPDGEPREILACEVSPDDDTIATSSGSCLQFWDAAAGMCLGTVEGHADAITCLAFRRSGGALVSGSEDKTLRVLDISDLPSAPGAAWEPSYAVLEGHTSSVLAVAWSPDGTVIASGSQDKSLRLWDTRTKELKHTLKKQKGKISALAFSPSGGRIATGSSDKTIGLWDVATGAHLFSLTGHANMIETLIFPSEGRLVSGGRDAALKLWDLEAQGVLANFPSHEFSVTGVTISGGMLASSSKDTSVRLWDLKLMEATRRDPDAHNEQVSGISMGTLARLIVSSSWDLRIKIWSSITGKCMWTSDAHKEVITAVTMSKDSCFIASGNCGSVDVWQLAHPNGSEWNKVHTGLPHAHHFRSLLFSDDNSLLSSYGRDDIINVWDMSSGALVCSVSGSLDEMEDAAKKLPEKDKAFVHQAIEDALNHMGARHQVEHHIIESDDTRSNLIRVFRLQGVRSYTTNSANSTSMSLRRSSISRKSQIARKGRLTACFVAPTTVTALFVSGNVIAVGCLDGSVLRLNAGLEQDSTKDSFNSKSWYEGKPPSGSPAVERGWALVRARMLSQKQALPHAYSGSPLEPEGQKAEG